MSPSLRIPIAVLLVAVLSCCADDSDDVPDDRPGPRRDSGSDAGTCTAQTDPCDDGRCKWETARKGVPECRAQGYPVSYLAHCGPYDAVVYLSGDSQTYDYYVRESGKRVGYLHTFPVWTCEAYDGDFALPNDDCEPFADSCEDEDAGVSDEDAGR